MPGQGLRFCLKKSRIFLIIPLTLTGDVRYTIAVIAVRC